MLYIVNTNLNENEKIKQAFTQVYGLNNKKSITLIKKLGFSKNIQLSELNETQHISIKNIFKQKNLAVLGLSLKKQEILRRAKKANIKYLKELRRLKGYPVNGQKTRTNGKTARKKLLN